MSFTVKAYLEASGRILEVRRFSLDQSVSSNHGYLVQKLSQIFPSLGGKSFTTYWKDSEGDLVAFSSDEELMEALSHKDDIFKVFLEVDGSSAAPDAADGSREQGEGLPHQGVVCDGCSGPIRGMRFKCTVCPDFDLCSACERKCLHTEHDMLRISKPRPRCMPWPRPEGGCDWPGLNAWVDWCHGARSGHSGASTQRDMADFFRHVGEQVSALLEPLGVDVFAEPKPCSSSCSSKSEQHQQQVPDGRSSCNAGGQPCPGRSATSANGSHASAQQTPPGQQLPAGETVQQQDAMLEAKVASAVEAMRVMGFHDDDGWLSSVLRSNGADIQRAVGEMLKKNACRYP